MSEGVTAVIELVIRADSSESGRKKAKLAVKKLCEQVGIHGDRVAAGIRIIFAPEDHKDPRPRISLGDARKLLRISNSTFWRWRRENRFGAGEIEIIPLHKTANETYLDQVIELRSKMRKAQ